MEEGERLLIKLGDLITLIDGLSHIENEERKEIRGLVVGCFVENYGDRYQGESLNIG
jgi:hypothetical protein